MKPPSHLSLMERQLANLVPKTRDIVPSAKLGKARASSTCSTERKEGCAPAGKAPHQPGGGQARPCARRSNVADGDVGRWGGSPLEPGEFFGETRAELRRKQLVSCFPLGTLLFWRSKEGFMSSRHPRDVDTVKHLGG